MSVKELDRKSELVFEAIYELGGEADTSEIKDYTGIDSNGVVSYRYDKLEDAGLIETRKVDTGETLPITIAELTEKGEDNVGAVVENGEPTLAERMADLREVVTETHSKVERFEGRLDHVEGRFESAEEVEGVVRGAREAVASVDQLTERVDALADRVERVEERQRNASFLLDDLVRALERSGRVDIVDRKEEFRDEDSPLRTDVVTTERRVVPADPSE